MSKQWEETVHLIQGILEQTKRGGSYEEMARALGVIEYLIDEWHVHVPEWEEYDRRNGCLLDDGNTTCSHGSL